MSSFAHRRGRSFIASAALVLGLAVSATGHAANVQYSFSGFTNSATLIDLGSGPVSAALVPFTVTGRTTNGVDLTPVGDGFGLFAATSTYDFGAFGSFTTNVGADRYFQDCFSNLAINCAGLYDPAQANGFLVGFDPIITDPDVALAVGSPTSAFFVGGANRYFSNSAGQQLFLGYEWVPSLSVRAVPEPSSVSLFLFATLLGWLSFCWRRSQPSF